MIGWCRTPEAAEARRAVKCRQSVFVVLPRHRSGTGYVRSPVIRIVSTWNTFCRGCTAAVFRRSGAAVGDLASRGRTRCRDGRRVPPLRGTCRAGRDHRRGKLVTPHRVFSKMGRPMFEGLARTLTARILLRNFTLPPGSTIGSLRFRPSSDCGGEGVCQGIRVGGWRSLCLAAAKTVSRQLRIRVLENGPPTGERNA